MNSIELMSSMSTMSGTRRPRIAVASLVTYWASGTGVRSILMRSCALWNRSTTTWTPATVAARHHMVTVPAGSPVKSGSASTPEPHASSAAVSPARAPICRNSLRRMSPPPIREPHAHRADAAVRPGVVRDRLVTVVDRDGRDALEQVGPVLGGAHLGQMEGVDALDRVHQRSPFDRDAAADGVDALVGGADPRLHRQHEFDGVARVPDAAFAGVAGLGRPAVDRGARGPGRYAQG